MEQPPIQPHTPDQITEETLRAQKLKELIESIDEDVLEYKRKLKTNSFTDETEKLAFQKRLTDKVKKAKRIKNGEAIQETESVISHHYQYTNPETNKVEHQEDIEINIEQSLTFFKDLYLKTNIGLPLDFDEQVQEIWNTNFDAIQSAVEEHGFNGVLIAPANIPLPELSEKMKMGDGYYLGDNFKNNGSFEGATSTGTDKPRIILYHSKSLPDIQKENGIDPHLSITARDAQSLYDANPTDYLGTLEDAIILERAHFEKTGIHISDYQKNSGHWLSGTKLSSGSRFVRSSWYPSDSELDVDAGDAGSSFSSLGCRPSRSFY